MPDDPETGDGFGASLATGDFDEDGYPDLAIGSPGEVLAAGEAPASSPSCSGAQVGYRRAGRSSSPALTPVRHTCRIPRMGSDMHSQPAISTEMVMPTLPWVRLPVAHSATIHRGHSSTAMSSCSTAVRADPRTVARSRGRRTRPTSPGDGEAGDWFGSSLETGDFDDDGYDDLAIGARFDRVNVVRFGAVDVLYGTASGLSAADAQLWHHDAAGVPSAAEAGDDFGHATRERGP